MYVFSRCDSKNINSVTSKKKELVACFSLVSCCLLYMYTLSFVIIGGLCSVIVAFSLDFC